MVPTLPSRRCQAAAARSEQREVVAVDDLALVRRPELAPQGRRGAADQARDLVGVEVDQPAGDRDAVGAGEVDRVAGDEGRRWPR